VLLLMALTGEAGATDKLGDPEACARTLRGALERFSALRSPDPAVERALSAAHRVLANAEMGLGSYDAALATFDRAYDLALSANAPVDAVDALNSRGALHYFRGQTLADRGEGDEAKRELDRAESTWQLALAQADQWDLLQHRSIILSNLGELEWLRGDPARAIATLEKAEALHTYLRSDQGLADTYRLFGECHLAVGSLARAEEYAARGLAIAERLDSPYWLGPIHRTMARVGHALCAARPDDAAARTRVKDHLGASLRAFEKAGMVKEVERTLTLARELGFDEGALHH
jgi:tetratricopeptide (TPR) repeat protein